MELQYTDDKIGRMPMMIEFARLHSGLTSGIAAKISTAVYHAGAKLVGVHSGLSTADM